MERGGKKLFNLGGTSSVPSTDRLPHCVALLMTGAGIEVQGVQGQDRQFWLKGEGGAAGPTSVCGLRRAGV